MRLPKRDGTQGRKASHLPIFPSSHLPIFPSSSSRSPSPRSLPPPAFPIFTPSMAACDGFAKWERDFVLSMAACDAFARGKTQQQPSNGGVGRVCKKFQLGPFANLSQAAIEKRISRCEFAKASQAAMEGAFPAREFAEAALPATSKSPFAHPLQNRRSVPSLCLPSQARGAHAAFWYNEPLALIPPGGSFHA